MKHSLPVVGDLHDQAVAAVSLGGKFLSCHLGLTLCLNEETPLSLPGAKVLEICDKNNTLSNLSLNVGEYSPKPLGSDDFKFFFETNAKTFCENTC